MASWRSLGLAWSLGASEIRKLGRAGEALIDPSNGGTLF